MGNPVAPHNFKSQPLIALLNDTNASLISLRQTKSRTAGPVINWFEALRPLEATKKFLLYMQDFALGTLIHLRKKTICSQTM